MQLSAVDAPLEQHSGPTPSKDASLPQHPLFFHRSTSTTRRCIERDTMTICAQQGRASSQHECFQGVLVKDVETCFAASFLLVCSNKHPRPSLGQDACQKMPSSSSTSLQSEALPKHHRESGHNKTNLGPASAKATGFWNNMCSGAVDAPPGQRTGPKPSEDASLPQHPPC